MGEAVETEVGDALEGEAGGGPAGGCLADEDTPCWGSRLQASGQVHGFSHGRHGGVAGRPERPVEHFATGAPDPAEEADAAMGELGSTELGQACWMPRAARTARSASSS